MEKVDRKWQIRFKVIRKERMGLATLHKPCTRETTTAMVTTKLCCE